MTQRPVLDLPREQEIRDELQRLVLADLHGPLGGDDEEFTGEENPIDRYPLGRLAPRGVVLEPDTHDELAAADAGDPSEADPEPSAPNVPSLNPSAVGFTAHIDGRVSELHLTAKWARYERARTEREQQRLAMAYRFHPEFASGSGAAVHAVTAEHNPLRAKQIHVRTVPDYEIPATDVPSADTDPDLAELADLELEMKRLAELARRRPTSWPRHCDRWCSSSPMTHHFDSGTGQTVWDR